MAKARSGQITVATAGTAVAGPSTPAGRVFTLAANAANTGIMYVGNDGAGDVSSANGYPLKPGDRITVRVAHDLSELYFDASVNGEKVAWFRQI